MLKTDWKQGLILLLFTFLMSEILTYSTITFVGIGFILALFKVRVHRYVRNLLALGVFASYWLTYGKIIDPEVGLNFLTSIIVLKILEKETVRDRYMIFFGLILLISAGSLFEKTLTYVLFFALSFLILINDFYGYLGQRWRMKDMLIAVLWVAPLTFLLFFLVPRLLNPIPFSQGGTSPGEIGYTPDVNISQIESLTPNQGPVFQVLVNKRLKQEDLYWRGNTLSTSDGWNWTQMPHDRESASNLLGASAKENEVKQNFRLYGRSEYFFTLDRPRVITYSKEFLGLGDLGTLSQKRWQWVQRYEVISQLGQTEQSSIDRSQYLQVPLNKSEKSLISDRIAGESLPEVEASLRKFFRDEKFTYSLSPGRSLSFQEFLDRKIGFCSHYASAVALILRIKGIPSRLVSGYMGGNYNRFADFYLISHNDAHVWVEAFSEGQWIRLDPTEWIAPDRVRLGGEAFVESVQNSGLKGSSFFRMPRLIQDLNLWFGQWDFIFYQWLEEVDYHSQEALLSRFKFKRQWLFSVIPLLMVVFMGLYMWFLHRQNRRSALSLEKESWRLFQEKLSKRGLLISPYSVQETQGLIENFQGKDKASIQRAWEGLVGLSFQGKGSARETYRTIRRL